MSIGTTRLVPHVRPYNWSSMLAFFRARAIDGVEHVEGDVYRRILFVDGCAGLVEVRPDPAANGLEVRMDGGLARQESAILDRLRAAFDTDGHRRAIRRRWSRDPLLASLVAARPWLRVPGGWDSFEVAVRAILGQQITVLGARRLGGQLVAMCGTRVPVAPGVAWGLTRAFPTPQQVLDADLDRLGMPGARRATLRALARATLDDPRLFDRSESVERTVARLRQVKGIGEWTAHYIALRASREPDAFPSSDIGLLRSAMSLLGTKLTPGDLVRRAESWRPWRAFAAQHLWAADAAGGVPRTSSDRLMAGSSGTKVTKVGVVK